MALAWLQHGVIYHVHPRSFQDTDGNGTGDLPGIILRLDYFVWLGVDAVWLSPIYPSPMTNVGYDVSDYCDIDPLFGTLADMDALIAATHARGLKVTLDYVPNHTSDQHPWFVDSRHGRASEKCDWFIWHDGAPGGGPPNNWQSHFGGSGWTWDEGSRQYFYHSFLPTQPELNWRSPQAHAAMFDVLRFWLARGLSKTTSSATTRRTHTGRPAIPRTTGSSRSILPTGQRDGRSWPKCALCRTSTRTGCSLANCICRSTG